MHAPDKINWFDASGTMEFHFFLAARRPGIPGAISSHSVDNPPDCILIICCTERRDFGRSNVDMNWNKHNPSSADVKGTGCRRRQMEFFRGWMVPGPARHGLQRPRHLCTDHNL
jgi:hypothetical protein